MRGKLICAKLGRERRKNYMNPRKVRTSDTLVGVGQLVTASTLSLLMCTPFASISCPRKVIRDYKNLHLRSLRKNLYFRNLSRTIRKCYMWSATLLLWMMISSRYTLTNLLVKSPNALFMTLWKLLGAFVRPNGNTNHSHYPCYVTNAVLSTLSSCIRNYQ